MALAAEQEGLVERVQELTALVDGIADPEARACAEELAAAIVQLYGAGLERIFAALAEGGAGAEEIVEGLAADGVVASLMLIHGLYPVDLETRVREALDSVRPYLDSHGGDVELLAVEDGIARLRLSGHCESCAASQSTVELAIEQALQESAPDLLGIDVEGVIAQAPVHVLPSQAAQHTWVTLDGVAGLGRGMLVGAGEGLFVANVAGTLLCYRSACAACGETLAEAELEGGTLTCPACARKYDLPRAGRCKDDDAFQLAPVPLLRENGSVRVALTV